ncbi:MAG: hypothetical protein DU429_06450 [Candidatus Tokpelaia sp.]|nr:MAG: hypothetical protein DU430_02010 [Candidatus Tokpelaia sp.]KAA6206204.1 MAG: hypothetical protein DU429_06450 [Candidatus Tokpelaia sp.]
MLYYHNRPIKGAELNIQTGLQKNAMRILFAIALFSLILTGCGGREAHPVAATNIGDNRLDCGSIEREIMANNDNIRATMKEKSNGQLKKCCSRCRRADCLAGMVFYGSEMS